MGQAKRRGTYEERVKQAQEGAAKVEKFIHDTDGMVMFDVAIANVFNTQLGITRIDRPLFPMKSTERNIQTSIEDHRQAGFRGTDRQILLSAWGVITGQCMAGAYDRGTEFFMSKPFLAFMTQSVWYILDKIGGDVKTIRLHLHGAPNATGWGTDPYICGWAPDSVIQLLDRSGQVIESVDYATLRHGMDDSEVLRHNAEMMTKWYERA